MERIGRLRRLGDARAAFVAFVALELASIPLLLTWGNRWWFWADDWEFLGTRTAWNLGDLFRSHYQHWVTLPVLAYRALWSLFGIRHYVPYQLLVIALHLVAALLLRAVMRRAGVRPWMASLFAAVFVFFGAGAENILIAFQITFVGSLVFGLTQLLLLDHDGRGHDGRGLKSLDRRDWLGVGAGLLGLMCSGVGVTMALIVGLAAWMRRGRLVALFHTVPLAVAYGLWSLLSPTSNGPVTYTTHSVVDVVKFFVIGAGSVFGRLGQVPGIGVVLAIVLVVGFVLAVDREDLPSLRGEFAVPVALVIGAAVFLVVTAVARAGSTPVSFGTVHSGPQRARQSRYVYLLAAMVLPLLAVALDALARKWRLLTVPAVALVLAGVPGNIHAMRVYTEQSQVQRKQDRIEILESPRLPLAQKLSPSLVPGAEIARFSGLSLGWLLESLPSGRIPKPPPLSPSEISTETLRLALRDAKVPSDGACRTIAGPTRLQLRVFDRMTLAAGTARIVYYPSDGAPSRPLPFEPKQTLVATTGPLDIGIVPVLQPTQLCGP